MRSLNGVGIYETLDAEQHQRRDAKRRPITEREAMKVDSAWFNDLIKRSPYGSQRRLSKKIRGRQGKPLEPSALSLMFRGKRAMQLQEARQIADLLDVPLIEVLRHAGIALPEEGVRTVPLAGYVDKDGVLRLLNGGKAKESIPGPGDLPSEAIAVRCMTARSESDLVDGWVFFAEAPGPVSSECLGRFCLVGPKKGAPRCAFVLRGYRAGTVNLLSGLYFGHLDAIDNVQLDWVAPVLWIRPQ